MKALSRVAIATLLLVLATYTGVVFGASIADAVDNANRPDSNTERDGARKPADMLAFIDLNEGDVILDYGSGGGYWSELFSTVVGGDGKVYAHQNMGERFDSRKDTLTAQLAPFGNIELLPMESGTALPLADNSVDTVMLSYLYHHLHYSEDSGEAFPASSAALLTEFSRVLKPGGTLIIIEHVAAAGSTRAESAGWHRTPPAAAKSDAASVGFDFDSEAPELYMNPEDDTKNIWFETGLSGKTTTFVHKYRKP